MFLINNFTVPSALVLNTSPTVTAFTITITGTTPAGSVVTRFVVRWQRDPSVGCSNVNQRSIPVNGGFTSYRITGLEPGNRYTITVTASNAAGSGPVSNSITAMTTETSERQSKLSLTTFCSPQFLLVVPPQSELVQSLPVVSMSSGRRCYVLIVMER